MIIVWLVTDVTAVGSSGRTECAILRVTLTEPNVLHILGVIMGGRVLGQIEVIFVVAEPLFNVRTSS